MWQKIKLILLGSVVSVVILTLLFFGINCWRDRDLQVSWNVSYGPDDPLQQQMDIFRPANNPALVRPAIVFVHGGGWIAGDKNDFQELAKAFARQGYVTASVNYRLATDESNHYPVALKDLQLAVRWLRAHAGTYHLDPDRIGALGVSAGGHLVAMLGVVDTLPDPHPAFGDYSSRVTCVVDFFGPTDLTADFSTNFAGPRPVPDILHEFMGHTKEDDPGLYREASPLYRIDEETVPFLILHGTKDQSVPFDQSLRFYNALRAHKVSASLLTFTDAAHGFVSPDDKAKAVDAVRLFFKTYLQ